ncbi:hypothetical protein [Sphingomonas jatrophae]|uniref:Uncharacterized protein n=1 Tax=Sphingomonas jatrophae TaxID=1166337 RepID=A0A1I6JZA5_9SPHN|nr:hypothetical protein [Sphingomonas jatrophae]SFR84284.1 hypothetical protein SAMN05192580_1116 [Sphingomonas jatrophae]
MSDTGYRYNFGAAVIACAVAGPIFVGVLAAGAFVDAASSRPLPVGNIFGSVVPALAILPLTGLFGAVLACLPVALGTTALTFLARRYEAAAAWGVWIGAGVAIAGGAGLLASRTSPEPMLALALTGAACAAIARRGLRRG